VHVSEMNNTVLAILVVLLGICVGLAWTNPATQDYGEYLETLISQALAQMDATESARQQNVVRDLLKSQGKFVITSVIRPNTTRRNYGLFSIFESRAFGLRLVVLGVGGEFIPLQGDNRDEVTRKLGQMILTPTR